MRSLGSLSRVLIVAGACAACGDRKPPVRVTPPDSPDAGATGATGATGDGGTASAPGQPPTDPGVRIAPHAAQIVGTVLDRAGTAAVTIDTLGDVRLWRSFDGTRPPVALPFHGARALELATDGAERVVGRIDASGAAHFYRHDADGRLLATGSAAAVPQAVGLVALTADRWALVRADHSIALVDASGALLDEEARTGVRLEALRPLGDRAAIAIVSRGPIDAATFAMVTIGLDGDALTWSAERPLAVTPLAPVELAASPDGKRLAYFADPSVAPAAPKGEPGPSASRAPTGPSMRVRRPQRVPDPPAVVVVVDAATGAVVTPKDLAASPLAVPQRLGFSANDTLHAFSASGTDITTSLDADAALVSSSLPRTGAPAIGPGVLVAGVDRNLLVQKVGGETRYLGYQVSSPAMAALSPDGSKVAWATGDGQVLIETLDGSAPEVHLGEPSSGVVNLEFLDDRRLFVASQRGVLSLYDASRGTELSAMNAPGASYTVKFEPRTGWVVGVRDGGGVWAVRVQSDAPRPWSQPRVIADGSAAFWLLDGSAADGAVLLTIDGNSEARRYTAAQLSAGVPVGKLAKIAKVKLAQFPTYVDPSGRHYALSGTELRVSDAVGQPDQSFLALASPRDLVRSPDGDTVIVFDQERTAFAVTAAGATRWSLGVGSAGWHPAFSRDGRRVALVSPSGGQIVDVATGAVIAARCGWQFGAYPTQPPGFSSQVHPICE